MTEIAINSVSILIIVFLLIPTFGRFLTAFSLSFVKLDGDLYLTLHALWIRGSYPEVIQKYRSYTESGGF